MHIWNRKLCKILVRTIKKIDSKFEKKLKIEKKIKVIQILIKIYEFWKIFAAFLELYESFPAETRLTVYRRRPVEFQHRTDFLIVFGHSRQKVILWLSMSDQIEKFP